MLLRMLLLVISILGGRTLEVSVQVVEITKEGFLFPLLASREKNLSAAPPHSPCLCGHVAVLTLPGRCGAWKEFTEASSRPHIDPGRVEVTTYN